MKPIYVDVVGNKLFRKYIKTRDVWQWFGKNVKGELLTRKDVEKLMKKAGIMRR